MLLKRLAARSLIAVDGVLRPFRDDQEGRRRAIQEHRRLRLIDLEERLLFSAAPVAVPVTPPEPPEVTQAQSDGAATPAHATPAADSPTGDENIRGSDAQATADHPVAGFFDTELAPTADIRIDAVTDATVATELVFVDTSVSDHQLIVDDLTGERQDGRSFTVILLNPSENGVQQIGETLARMEDVDAIHILSHGTEGAVKLGNAWLSEANLGVYAPMIGGWAESLTPGADILFYGCDLAANDAGQFLIESLSTLLDADVAASNDATGSTRYGGDWELEFTRGDVRTFVATSELLQDQWGGLLATLNVTQTDDVVNGDTSSVAALIASDGGDGISLREAIIAVNNGAGGDDIRIAAGTYKLSIGGTGEDAAASGDLDILKSVTINGTGAGSTTIDADELDRVFDILGGTTVINDLTIRDGNTSGDGGGIRALAGSSVSLNGVRVRDNEATTGAGIYNAGTLVIADSVIRGNGITTTSGGGVYNTGQASLHRTTVRGNTATNGAGLYQASAATGTFSLTNVTLSGNTATASGGGLYAGKTVTLVNSTVASNGAGNTGGGLLKDAGVHTVTLTNTIVADNTATVSSPDVSGTFISSGFNLIENTTGGTGFGGTDILGVDPQLDALTANGGLGATHALMAGSAAIDAGTGTATPAIDQRGTGRDVLSDIGAYEYTDGAHTVLYWIDAASGELGRSKADGTGVQVLLTGLTNPNSVAVDLDGEQIYWSDKDDQTISRANPDGSGVTLFLSALDGLESPEGIDIDPDGGKLYFVDNGLTNNRVKSVNLGGGPVTTLATIGQDPTDLAVDTAGGWVYWTDRGVSAATGRQIRRIDLAGVGPAETVFDNGDGLARPTGIDIDADNGMLYWLDADAVGLDELQRIALADLDPANIETLPPIAIDSIGFSVDSTGGRIYWTDAGMGQIGSADLAGADDEVVLNGLGNPTDVEAFTIAGVVNTPPTVSLTPLVTTLAEDANTATGIHVANVVITDDGEGTNTLSLSGADAAMFELRAGGTELHLKSGVALDFETNAMLDVTVEVNDATVGGTPDDTDSHTINLTDVNDVAPVIDPLQSFDIAENSGNGTSVGFVTATDPDTVGSFTNWTITAGNTDGIFAISNSTGELTVVDNTKLDYETLPNSYTLSIRVEDGVNTSAVETVTVDVTDLNDVAPTIDPLQSFDIAENSGNGTSVGFVTATDPDTVGSFTNWTITGGNTDGIFGINNGTGELTVIDNTKLDHETLPNSYTLSVRVEDGVNTSAVETVTVDVTDLNDVAPTIDPLQSFDIAENSGNGTSVGFVTATDPDTVGSFTNWTITSGNTDGIFDINDSTGELTVVDNTKLDYETLPNSYTLSIRVEDGVNTSAVETVTVNVTDLNDVAPTIDPLQSFDIAENSGNGTSVGFVTATDPDTVGSFTNWTITGGNTDGIFGINNGTGELTVIDNTKLDHETLPNSYTLSVRVEDGVNTSAVETVTVDVTDLNDVAPTIDALQSFDIAENSGDGTSVGFVTAMDPDTVGSFTNWTITGGNTDGIFGINNGTGELTVIDNTKLDYETLPNSYTLSIRVEDGVNTSAVDTVTVNVTDLNDVAPTIDALQSFDIAENSGNGTSVGFVTATDPDTVGSFTNWTITSGNIDGIFGINNTTGELTVVDNTKLDYETLPNSYTLSVRVEDGVNTSAVETVTIDVTDLNDVAPTIDALQSFDIAENSGNGTSVGFVTATDPDTVGSFTNWAITSGNIDGIFGINNSTGELTVVDNTNLDYETLPNSYTLSIRVEDGVNTSAVETVTVDVTDLNDVVPVVDPLQTLTVNEFAENGTELGTLTATDPDTVGSLQGWTITAGNDDGVFVIDAASGEITLDDNSTLDFETQSVYMLTVTVSDGTWTSPGETVTINVIDSVEDATLWFSTKSAGFGGGAPWTDAQLVQFGDGADTFDTDAGVTDGTLGTVGGFSSPVDIRGIHHVTTSITLGTTGPQFTLNPGDVILALDATGTFNTGDGNPTNDFSADRHDLVVFRPDDPQDYQSGTWHMLLDEGVHSAGNTHNFHGISLVEQDTTIGGTTLSAGTFLVSHSTPALHKNVYTFTVTGTGQGADTDTSETNLLLSGPALGIASHQVQGLHLFQQHTVLGTQLFETGTLLMAVNGTDVLAGVPQTKFDIVALDVTGTEQDTTTAATGVMFFDGSDIDLTGDEAINGLAILNSEPLNSTPTDVALDNATVVENASGVLIGNLSATDPDPTDTHTFTVDDARFEISGSQLRLKAGQSIDHEMEPTVNLVITAFDQDGVPLAENFVISVTDLNDVVPVVDPLQTLTVNEFAENGTELGTLTATDPDTVGSLQGWTITAGNDDGVFVIDAASGEITLDDNSTLDFETQSVYMLTVTVSDGTWTSPGETVTINVIDSVEDATLWFSTKSAGFGGGAPWTDAQLVQFGDGADTFDTDAGVTDGTLGTVGGFSSPVDIRGIHHVTTSITLGTTGPQFTLNPGDVILALDATGTFNTGDGNPTNDFSADRHDLVVFRPDDPQDYQSGTWHMLLDEGVHSAGKTHNFHGISLVEQDTTIGGTTLSAGTFLVSHSSGALHMNVYTFTVTGTGQGADTDTSETNLLLSGPALGIASHQVQGLHLFQQHTVLGTQVFETGTLLMAVNGTDVLAGVPQTKFDIVALDVTGTEQDTTTAATGVMFFDGSDIDLTGDEAINGLAILNSEPLNSTPTDVALDNATVTENASGVLIGNLSATDPDPTDTHTFTVDDARFEVSGSQLRLKAGQSIDREMEPTVNLVITAFDQDGVPLAENIVISVTDLNDVAPVVDPLQSFNIAEHSGNGTSLGFVTATDPDTAGGLTNWTITGGNTDGIFGISASTGELTVIDNTKLDYETLPSSYTLSVRVEDGVHTSAIETVTVDVTDLNDVAPVIDPLQSFNIAEHSGNGTSLGFVTATDPDTVGGLTNWVITGGNTDGIFGINIGTGELTVVNNTSLDHETLPNSYTLSIRVQDGVNTSATGTVTVNVTDINDITPVIDPLQSFNIAEHSANGTSLGLVTATDPDIAGGLTNWVITGGNTDAIFSINLATGELTVVDNANLDYETLPNSYTLSIRVEDGVHTSAIETVTVDVTDANDIVPVIDPLQSFNVAENSGNGTSLGFVTATDGDTVGGLTNWTITGGNTDGIFGIKLGTGELTVVDNTKLDFETLPNSYTLSIRVEDGANTSAIETVTVDVTDLNDVAPTVDPLQSFNVAEHSGNGTSLGFVTATDPDTVGGLTNWTITGGNTDGLFGINLGTGELTVVDNTKLDFETLPNSYTLSIRVEDGVNTSAIETVTVDVTDINDVTPVVDPLQSFNIAEHSANGTSLGFVTATDPDTVGGLTNWTITAGNTDGIFGINLGTGELTVVDNTKLDFETLPNSYTLSIRVEDGVNTSAIETITVDVTDTNDMTPVIDPLQSFNVAETAGNGSSVGFVTATDPDTVGGLTNWTITGGNTDGIFGINVGTGELTVVDDTKLDFETLPNSYTLSIRVEDGVNVSAIETVTVDVIDINEGAPVIDPSQSFDVAEHSGNGTSLGFVTATDPDAPGSLTNWMITSGNTDGIFAINLTTGELTVVDNTKLDHETPPNSYTLGITVEDGANTSAVETVTVNVTDINDVAPVIDPLQTFNVAENAGNGTSLGFVTATDPDTVGALINWTITGGNTDSIFGINLSTGELTVADNTNLDFETLSNSYTLSIRVEDGVHTSAIQTVTVDVTDLNDVVPIIDPLQSFDIAENSGNGTSLGFVTATDPDTLGGLTNWTITGGNIDGIFGINAATGELTVVDNTKLDHETLPNSYTLSVRVEDGVNTSAIETVTVDVTDLNDVTPVISPLQTFNVLETAANGTSVGVVTATDPDTVGGLTNWTITGGNSDGIFGINSGTGELTVVDNTNLDFDTLPNNYVLSIRVEDGAHTSPIETVVVNVLDSNDNGASPIVDTDAAANDVSELAGIGAGVGVTAFSDDPDLGDTISYSLDDDAGGLFRVHATTGVVTVNGVLDYEASTSHSIVVRATSTDLSTVTESYVISVIDANDTAPTISAGQVFGTPENALTGDSLGFVSASDPDTVGALTNWTITSGNVDGIFEIDAGTGELRILDDTSLDFETLPNSYVLSLQVDDGANTSAAQTVQVNVSDVNEAPTLVLTPTVTALPENTDVGAGLKVADITVVDDALGTNVVTLTGDDAALFELRSGGTELFLKAGVDLDFEADNALDVTVDVDDATIPGTPDDSAAHTVNVTDVNEPATVSLTNTVNLLAENTNTATSLRVADITVSDDGLGSNALSLTGDDAAMFEIRNGGTELHLRAGAILDFETNNVLDVSVQVDDAGIAGSPDDAAAHSVSITDVNDAPSLAADALNPTFTEGDAAVRLFENTRVDTGDDGDRIAALVLTVSGIRNGANERLLVDGGVVSLTPGTNRLSPINLYRTAVSGVATSVTLTISRPGDFTAAELETLVDNLRYINTSENPLGASRDIRLVSVRDDGGTLDSGVDTSFIGRTSTVAVNSVNDAPTISLTNTLVTIDEDADTGAAIKVADIVVTDDGEGTNTLTLSGSDAGLFRISGGNELQLRPGTRLDFITNPDLDVTVNVTDASLPGAPQDRASHTVSLVDVNDNPPVIDPGQTFSVDEDASNGTSLGTITATDLDTVGALQDWTIVGGNTGGIFGVTAGSGELRIVDATNLDFETKQSWVLSLTVSDGANTSAVETIRITVNDVNEHGVSRVTDIDPSRNHVSETAPPGTGTGLTARATDPDAFDTVRYTLTDDAGGRFAINGSTGLVTVAGGLDFESDRTHSVVVEAASSDGSRRSETFVITIDDANDTPPKIDAGQSFALGEDSPLAWTIGTVTATDPDGGALRDWQIVGGNADGVFTIAPGTGVLSVADTAGLDFESRTVYRLRLAVSDGVHTSLVETVTINVSDVNDNAPIVLPHQSWTAPETPSAGFALGVAAARDVDTVGRLQGWRIVGGNPDGIFGIDPSSGQLTIVLETRLSEQVYALSLTVSDGTHTSRAELITITVSGGLNPFALPSDPPESPGFSTEPAVDPVVETPEQTDPNNTPTEAPQTRSQPGGVSAPIPRRGGGAIPADPLQPLVVEDEQVVLYLPTPEPELLDTANERAGLLVPILDEPGTVASQQAAVTVFEELNHLALPGQTWDDLDAVRDQFETQHTLDDVTIGTIATVGSGLTVGYVLWLLRSGILLSSILAQMPAWRLMDPLLILQSLNNFDDDDESLQTIVDSGVPNDATHPETPSL